MTRSRDDGEPGLYSHDILLPVGTIVHGELPAELVEGFAPYGGLTRTDLMVDMEGGARRLRLRHPKRIHRRPDASRSCWSGSRCSSTASA